MSTNNKKAIGHLDKVDALSFLNCLILVGRGTNTSSGWKNWFEPERAPNHYAFMQEPPAGNALAVMLPFTAVGFFPLNNARAVFVHELVDGKLTEVEVPVRHASILEVESLKTFVKSPDFLKQGFKPETDKAELEAANIPIFRKHLGTVDIPVACATWNNPLRARRFELYLEIQVGEAQDIERAVLDCLKQSGIAAALIFLLTPVGWAAGTSIFQHLLEACLLTKLKKVISVNLPIESHCL